MYCPRCGQEQLNRETKFCSRCGFLMTGVEKLIQAGGALPEYLALREKNQGISARKRGVKKGAQLFFAGVILVPLLGILTEMFNGEGYIVGVAAIITFLGGILRLIYALLFETSDPAEPTLEDDIAQVSRKFLKKTGDRKTLPAEQSIPATDYVQPPKANWRETSDLTPGSVTEETTTLLDKDKL